MSNETTSGHVHNLKLAPQYFDDVYEGKKTFECRINDRNFEVGDELILYEFNPVTKCFLGRVFCVRVTYILPGGQHGILSGYVVMSVTRIPGAEINMNRIND